ncbi:peptidoglycan editing factor PgeF [Pelagibacteraceae bacterium]|nr:peptidoglycan editing factor PgeF [Candidatus Pelagibacter sp.]MDC1485451.1 peptidoglycan editing factor PgeF [Pelagibacteraceae bacterium]
MIKSKKISKFKVIKHGFFNRRGGTSKGIYKSLNCGLGSSDEKKNVINNLKIVCKKIGVRYKKLVLLNQIHSNKFYFIKKNHNFSKRIKADSLITNVKNIAIGVLTADCVPILIYDKNKNFISAIHAGWKGAYKGVINNTINFLLKNGSNRKNLVAVIGPCISEKNYEIKKNFKDKFIKKNPANKKFFRLRKKKSYFCLNDYVYSQLRNLGIKNLEVIKKNTFDTKNNFFSARRALKNKENDYGRNISIIMIN